MVKEKEHNGKVYYKCEECDMYYETFELAERCEKYCNERHACDMDIIKHAIDPQEKRKEVLKDGT